MHAPLFAWRTSSVRDVHCIYLPPPSHMAGVGPFRAWRSAPGMTHAIPTCCQVASRTTSVRGVYCMYLHPTISTWLGLGPFRAWRTARGMTHTIPACCQFASDGHLRPRVSIVGTSYSCAPPPISHGWEWARSGHGVPPGDGGLTLSPPAVSSCCGGEPRLPFAVLAGTNVIGCS